MEKKHTHMKYGLFTGLAMIIVNLILFKTGVSFNPGMQYVSDIPFIIGIIMNAMAFSKLNDGYVTFGNVFSSGFKACAIITLLLAVWSFASVAIFPELKEKGLEIARKKMAENPQMTDDQIEMALSMTKKYWNVFMVGAIVFGTMILGAVFSLVGAAVAKKKGAMPEQLS